MDWRRFARLAERTAIAPPPLAALPPLPAPPSAVPAASRERQPGYPRFPIDPEDFN